MVTILNSYILPDSVIDKMRNKIQETKDRKIELGFGLCRVGRTNVLITGGDCTGSECGLEEPRECSVGLYVGGYHTHPRTGTKPSIADLVIAYDSDVECIGSVKEDNIKCIVRTGSKVPEIGEQLLNASKNVEEALGETVTKEELSNYERIRDSFLNNYFKTIDVK